jgi:hypothetical protein
MGVRKSGTCKAPRLQAAAAKLRTTPDLGLPEFRESVAGWLDHVADVSARLESGNAGYVDQTLPQVVRIIEVIERQ